MAGISPTGFEAKTFETILSEINNEQRSDISDKLNQSTTSVLGQINGITSAKLAELWEGLEGVYNSQYPDTATGASLANVLSYTGVEPQGGVATIVDFTFCELEAGVTLPAGSVASLVNDPSVRFTLDVAINNPGPSTDLIVGNFTAVVNGPTVVPNNAMSVIAEPVTGWLSVTNPLSGITGTNQETDNEARFRREQQFALQGSGTLEGIKSAVLEVSGVSGVTVRENTSDTAVGQLLPHSVNVIISGFFNAQAMAETIFNAKGAGIATSGAESEPHTDSQGIVTTVRWDAPTELEPYIDIDLTFDPGTYPPDGDEQVATAISIFVDTLDVGRDILVTPLACAVFDAVSGVVDIDTAGIRIGVSANPTATGNFSVGETFSTFGDTSRITVTSTS